MSGFVAVSFCRGAFKHSSERYHSVYRELSEVCFSALGGFSFSLPKKENGALLLAQNIAHEFISISKVPSVHSSQHCKQSISILLSYNSDLHQ